MRSREIQSALAKLTGRPLSEIDQRCRPLRGEGELTIGTGARGASAPHQTIADAMLHVLALVARRPKDVLDLIERLVIECKIVLPQDDTSTMHREMLDRYTVGTAVLGIMTAKDLFLSRTTSIEIDEDGSIAWMNLVNSEGERHRVLFSTERSERNRNSGLYRIVEDNYSGRRLVLSAISLRELGRRVLADMPEAEEATG